MKKVIITGGLGFIGSNIAKKFVKKGYKVKIIDNLDPDSGANLYNIYDFRDKVEFIRASILDYNKIFKHIKNTNLIINCAASTSHNLSMKDPMKNLDVNIKGVLSILEAIKNSNRKIKIIQIGTTTQIGNQINNITDETHPEFPKDMYSANKMAAEKYVMIYCNSYNIPGAVVRLPNTYGPRAAIYNPELTFNNYFIGLAIQKKKIPVFGNGNQKRNIIFVEDAVNAIYLISLKNLKNPLVLLAAGNKHYSLRHIAETTSKFIGGKVIHKPWPKQLKNNEIGDVKLSNKNIKKFIDWQPVTNIQQGIKLSKEFFMKNKKHYLM